MGSNLDIGRNPELLSQLLEFSKKYNLDNYAAKTGRLVIKIKAVDLLRPSSLGISVSLAPGCSSSDTPPQKGMLKNPLKLKEKALYSTMVTSRPVKWVDETKKMLVMNRHDLVKLAVIEHSQQTS